MARKCHFAKMNWGITVKTSQFEMIWIRMRWLRPDTCQYGNDKDLLIQIEARMKWRGPNHEKNRYYSRTFSNTPGKCGVEIVCFYTTTNPSCSLKAKPSQRSHSLSRNGTQSGSFSLQPKLGELLFTKDTNPTQYEDCDTIKGPKIELDPMPSCFCKMWF